MDISLVPHVAHVAPVIKHLPLCKPVIKEVLIGVTYMTAFIAAGISLVVGIGSGYLLGKLGISGIKADIAAIKAKIEPTPAPVVVVAPVTPAV